MRTFYIPVELCEFVLSRKVSKPFKLYILLKTYCDGKLKLTDEEIQRLKRELNVKSSKTIKNNLSKLLELNFLGYNRSSGYYFIRGFNQLQMQLDFYARTSVEFDLENIHNLQSFCYAAVIGYVVKQKQKKLKMQKLSERKKGRSNQDSFSSSLFSKVSNSLMSRKLSLSMQNVYKLRLDAQRQGFIKVRKCYIDLNIPAKDRKIYLKAHPEKYPLLRVRNNKLKLQDTDEITPLLRYKYRKIRFRKKNKAYIKGL